MESVQSGQEKSSLSACDNNKIICSDGDSGKVETSCGETAVCLDLQTAGKPKKAHFKFFGGKSICTLPSFFWGKHKGLGKGNLRKGLSKSKTHDCISDAQIEDSSCIKLHGLELTSVGTCLTSSHITDVNVTAPAQFDSSFHDTSPHGSTDCFEKKINGEKSLSLPRPKKGLKGLFSSIRRHKKNKIPDVEKSELCVHAAPCVVIEQVNKLETEKIQEEDHEQSKTECLTAKVSQELSLNTSVGTEETESLVCLSDVSLVPSVELPVEPDNLSSLNKGHSLDTQLDLATICSSDNGIFSEIVNPDGIDKVPLSSGDQISLIFEDVSSLKSFDSLTGCGDIIADQDIDTISDNAISLEQSRETTKKSSCLVTYQGGGEEMATPDDMEEEYLQQLLEDANEAEGSYELHNEKEATKLQTAFSQAETTAYTLCAHDPSIDRAVLNNTELLTPQSDQQESVPNSDEGYYDSNTPGPEDDSGDAFNYKERLPRDSYSGDALYEFYEPDDSLMSPAPGGESLYETKMPCSEIFEQFFDFSPTSNSDLIQHCARKKCTTETEEERLAVIQKQLFFWERQRENALKGMGHISKGNFPKQEQNVECKNAADILCHNKDGHSNDCNLLQNLNKGGANRVAQNTLTEKQSWNNFQDKSFRDSYYEGTYIQQLDDDNRRMNDPRFELNVPSLGTQDLSESRNINTVVFPRSRLTPGHHRQNAFGPDIDCHKENECEQAVNFSQTFAQFTSNTTLFSSISDCYVSAGSSRSFHHDLNALPTMVTFDVVDVENEAECENHVGLSPDEVAVSSFETFDHCYVQESLADCEDLFHTDLPNLFQSYNLGVTSLPRHFGHHKLYSSMPAPLSSNRRSRSLDTENLEIELGAMHLSKSGLRSYDFLVPWEDGKNSYEKECLRAHGTEWGGCNFVEQSSQTPRQFSQYSPAVSSNHGYGKANEAIIPSKPLPLNNRQMAKATDPHLQYNTREYHEVSTMCGYPAEQTTKKLAFVLPLEDKRGLGIHQISYKSHTSGKPVGITQAMPKQNKNEDNCIKPAADYKEHFLKRPVEQEVSANEKWANNYTECTGKLVQS